jgi:hypothetical protein
MPLPKRTIKVTKLEAARSQLKTAITLWFSDGDPASILALAHGSHEILHRIYRNRGFSDLLYDAKKIKEEYRADFVRALKVAPNFIKHQSQDTTENENTEIEFPFGTCAVFIVFSIIALMKIVGKLSDEETAFWVWCGIQEPSVFLKDAQIEQIQIDISADVSAYAPKEFFNLVLRALPLIRERNRSTS